MCLSADTQNSSSGDLNDESIRPAKLLFRLYKSIISPALHSFSPSRCVYLPTCSEYTYVAFARFGVVRGSWLSLRRVLRCNPFAKGGLDPVPEVSRHRDRLP